MDLLSIRKELMSGKSIYDLNLRVTFYARVSSEKENQLNSLGNQVFYYENKIKSQKNKTDSVLFFCNISYLFITLLVYHLAN